MNIRSLLIAATAISAVATAAAAQPSASADVDATAKFITALAITGAAPLNFGTWVKPTATGTIVIDPTGARSGDLTAVTDAANAPSAAAFNVTSEGGQSVGLAISQTSAAGGYTLSNFTVAGDTNCAAATATVLSMTGVGSQTCQLKIGASLAYPANASGAVDLGQLQAVVTYN